MDGQGEKKGGDLPSERTASAHMHILGASTYMEHLHKTSQGPYPGWIDVEEAI